ncbi:porin [Paraburkholderia jirisanensis]
MFRKAAAAAAALSACATLAHAQSSVMLYGIVDSTIRYSTHENPQGNDRFTVGDGAVTGSRFGLRGSEDLGGSMKAVFWLENGFNPASGTANQSGRLFGRISYVGLESEYGNLYLGRQYTIAHVAIAKWDVFQLANNALLSFEGGNITALRNDSMVKYTKSFGGLTISGQYTFGGVAGDVNANSVRGASVIYEGASFGAGAFVQSSDDVSAAYYGAVPAALASRQLVWGLGGTYLVGPVKLYAHYENSQLDIARYRNQTFSLGAAYTITPTWQLLGQTYLDKLKHPGANGDGTRFTAGLVLDYFLSKSTDVYTELDYTKLSGGWINLANNTALGTASLYGNASRLGVMLGMRHRF